MTNAKINTFNDNRNNQYIGTLKYININQIDQLRNNNNK